MNRFLGPFAVTLLSLAAYGAALHASTQARTVEVLVNGSPQEQFAHDGRWYIEALKGREYAIRLRNPYGVRVAVALSVDGLNTIDARQTTAARARKWVLDPYETVVISGWQTSSSEARRFEFTTEPRSYAQALGSPENIGIISAVFFRERQAPHLADPQSESSSAAQPPAAIAGAVPAPSAKAGGAARNEAAAGDYAATGMGRATEHNVTQVWLDLEEAPAVSTNIRYEFRSQLVTLGILPPARPADALPRRERARGFEPGFSPVVK
jgi:hypothetical protein